MTSSRKMRRTTWAVLSVSLARGTAKSMWTFAFAICGASVWEIASSMPLASRALLRRSQRQFLSSSLQALSAPEADFRCVRMHSGAPSDVRSAMSISRDTPVRLCAIESCSSTARRVRSAVFSLDFSCSSCSRMRVRLLRRMIELRILTHISAPQKNARTIQVTVRVLSAVHHDGRDRTRRPMGSFTTMEKPRICGNGLFGRQKSVSRTHVPVISTSHPGETSAMKSHSAASSTRMMVFEFSTRMALLRIFPSGMFRTTARIRTSLP